MSDGEVAALLREVVAELRAIRAALERRREVAAPLDVVDRRALAALLPVVAAQFPDGFECWELFNIVEMGGIAGSDMKLGLGAMNAHRVGKLLRRVADHGGGFAGFRVLAAGRGRWRLIADPSAFSTAPVEAKVASIGTSGGAR